MPRCKRRNAAKSEWAALRLVAGGAADDRSRRRISSRGGAVSAADRSGKVGYMQFTWRLLMFGCAAAGAGGRLRPLRIWRESGRMRRRSRRCAMAVICVMPIFSSEIHESRYYVEKGVDHQPASWDRSFRGIHLCRIRRISSPSATARVEIDGRRREMADYEKRSTTITAQVEAATGGKPNHLPAV